MESGDAERAEWAAIFVRRLERLCHLEERLAPPPENVANPQQLVYKAIFATYYDCLQLGRKEEADRLLAGHRQTVVAAPPG